MILIELRPGPLGLRNVVLSVRMIKLPAPDTVAKPPD